MVLCSSASRSSTGARLASRALRCGNTAWSSRVWCPVTIRQYEAQYAPSVQLFCRSVIWLIAERAWAALGKLGPQVVVDLDKMTGDRPAVRGVPGTGRRLRPCRPGGLVPEPDRAE